MRGRKYWLHVGSLKAGRTLRRSSDKRTMTEVPPSLVSPTAAAPLSDPPLLSKATATADWPPGSDGRNTNFVGNYETHGQIRLIQPREGIVTDPWDVPFSPSQ